ncbi:hypothetical protein YpAngola_A2359 [Yersinia pestis Angola]|nr:hypothetical protein YpAngola_A2359 [Yersinia pestis Angola]
MVCQLWEVHLSLTAIVASKSWLSSIKNAITCPEGRQVIADR